MPRPAASAHRYTYRDDRQQDAARPYGAWYPLVRAGHFVLMAAASCLIILTAFGVLAALALLVTALAR